MKDSQLMHDVVQTLDKYIKANNERFSTSFPIPTHSEISISRRIMKDSQHVEVSAQHSVKYIKANNERFSTSCCANDSYA